MKVFSLVLSVITSTITLFFLITDFPDISTFNGIIYFSLLIVLLLICITGIIVNFPIISRVHHKFRPGKY